MDNLHGDLLRVQPVAGHVGSLRARLQYRLSNLPGMVLQNRRQHRVVPNQSVRQLHGFLHLWLVLCQPCHPVEKGSIYEWQWRSQRVQEDDLACTNPFPIQRYHYASCEKRPVWVLLGRREQPRKVAQDSHATGKQQRCCRLS